MKKFIILIIFTFCSIILMEGCASGISEYAASAESVENIKHKYNDTNIKLKIELSSLNRPGTKVIGCRFANPVTLPKGLTYESYIFNALLSEIKFARLYSEASQNLLYIHFKKIDFNSNIGMGKWIISANCANTMNEGFDVVTKYDFSTSFGAQGACAQVADAFPLAVQKFIDDLILNPNFERIIKGL